MICNKKDWQILQKQSMLMTQSQSTRWKLGFQTKSDQTNVLLLDGRNHMTGDLDMRGNKIILPGEIDMNRKLITNLDTDQNQDLSAVNMATLKTNIGQKVDKKYVDGKFVKKTGGYSFW